MNKLQIIYSFLFDKKGYCSSGGKMFYVLSITSGGQLTSLQASNVCGNLG